MILQPASVPFQGKLLVVGGQCSKVGKTALCEDLIRLLTYLPWTAVKITPHAESGCPVQGPSCGCGPWEHTFSILEERDRASGKDTSRYLQAGAQKAFWVQAKPGRLADAVEDLRALLAPSKRILIESDAIATFWRPELMVLVIDPRRPDFKASTRAGLASTDLVLLRAPLSPGALDLQDLDKIARIPHYLQPIGCPMPAHMQELVIQHFGSARHQT